jgi:flagellar biosynthesis/type III secretory pathway ATPase
MSQVVGAAHEEDARLVRRALASLAQTEDARNLGIMPADPFALRAMAVEAQLEALLRQDKRPVRPVESLSSLAAAADTLR